MEQITPRALADWLADPERTPPMLLDVREPWEFGHARIETANNIPMSAIVARAHELPRDRPVVCICHHGGRSAQVAYFLEHQGIQAINLAGGIDQWSLQVDSAIPRY